MAQYNEAQQQAIDSNANKLLILAGAGTGKSHTLLGRIARFLAEGEDAGSVLALTFTNAAAFEMKERFKKQHPNVKTIPEFRTFHAFCYALLSRDADVRACLNYSEVPRIADEVVIKRIETLTKMQTNCKLSPQVMLGKRVPSPKEQWELDLYRKRFNQNLRREGYITFDILCYEVCDLFTRDDPTIQQYKSKYKFIYVDEFQDTDERQWEFVSSFKDAKICVVGDALQNLYSFRGTTSQIIKDLAEESEWETVRLTENYRSTIEICEFANENSLYAKDEYRIPITATTHGTHPHVMYARYNMCNVEAVKEVSDLHSKGLLGEDVAVLARTNAEVKSIVGLLTERGIVCRQGKPNTEAIHMLKSAVDAEYYCDWLSAFLRMEDYAEYQRMCNIERGMSRAEVLANYFYSNIAISRRVQKISNIIDVLKTDEFPFIKINAIYEILGYKDIPINTPATSTREILEYMIATLEDMQQSGVYVGTIHSSKGLEYERVFLVGVGSKSFRLTNEDNNNLYYVGITRAKRYLTVVGERV